MSRPPMLDKEVDLRDFPFMPVDIVRLLGSDFNAMDDDTAWRIGFTLWLRSYHQVPAGSLPGNDAAIMRLAELGKDTRTWKRIKDLALRGWVPCDDGRLYHPVVVEKALEGWIEKLAHRKSSAAGNAKRYGLPFDPVPFDADIERAREQLYAVNPQSRMISKRGGKYAPGTPGSTPGGTPDGSKSDPKNPRKGMEGKGREDKGREGTLSSSSIDLLRGAGASASEPEQAYVKRDSEQGRAWWEHQLAITGKYPPQDKNGGWYFPSEWPPNHQPAQASAA